MISVSSVVKAFHHREHRGHRDYDLLITISLMPNGREIAYTRVGGSAPTQIYLVRPDGTHAHPLIR